MKLSELRQLIREEAKKALNESSTTDANILKKEIITAGKKFAEVSKNLMDKYKKETEPFKEELLSLKSKYDVVIANATNNDIKSVEIEVKKKLPGAKVQIIKSGGDNGIKITLTSIKDFNIAKYQDAIRDISFTATRDAGISNYSLALEARDVYYRKLKTSSSVNNNPLVSGYDTGYMKKLEPDSRKYDEPGKTYSKYGDSNFKLAPTITELTLYFTDKYKKSNLNLPDFISVLSDNLKNDEYFIVKDALKNWLLNNTKEETNNETKPTKTTNQRRD